MTFKSVKASLINNFLNRMLFQYLLLLFVVSASAIIINKIMWMNSTGFMHTALETICVFISIAAFLVVWYTHSFSEPISHTVGFGYLVVGIFNMFHLYFYPYLNLYPRGYHDLSVRFWLFSRVTEAIVMIVVAFGLYNGTANRWIGLFMSLVPSLIIAHVVIFVPWILPSFSANGNFTPAKILIEAAILIMLIISLIRLRKQVYNTGILTYKYIYMAILFAIPTELCYIFGNNSDGFIILLGHLLKITSFLYLFKGIFVSAVIYPYEKLKEEQRIIIQQEKLALLGQLGAAIVHETKNSLAVIKGTNQLLSSIARDDRIKLYAKKVDIATDEVNRIISGFLALSKPKAPEMSEISLNTLIESIKSTLKTSILLGGIDMNILYEKDEKIILGDESQIKQVILNICKNASEALTEVNNPMIMITTQTDKLKDYMHLIISDNGKGMTEEEKLKIGTPFFTTKKEGTGLGLSVCFQIIKDHGGTIAIESQPGKGTTFIVSFPCINTVAA